jgi:diguanylate cyclase (GGDEF)-like protein/PAS domain S-box-containing protein
VADLVGKEAFWLIHPDDQELAALSLLSMNDQAQGTPLELRLACKGGGWRTLELVGVNRFDDPRIGGVVIVARDMTDRRRWELLGDDPERFRVLVQNSAAIMMLVTADGIVSSVSGALARVLGQDPAQVEGSPLVHWMESGDRDHAIVALARATSTPGTTTFAARFLHREREESVPLELAVVNLLDDPIVQGLVVSAHDITSLHRAQRALEHLATHDALTDLPNRALLDDRLSLALRRTASSSGLTAVLFTDLDRFKPVNDLLGHDAGDELLRQLARRLEGVTRPSDTVARFGGDEFVIVAESLASVEEATSLARRVEEVVAEPFDIFGQATQVFASVGVVVVEGDGASAESVLAEADAAMYAVKAARRGGDRRNELRVTERRLLAESLRNAVRDEQLEVHYQPIVDVRRGNVVGFEALVRWHHLERGLLPPISFLDVAEDAGLDVPIGSWVLETACNQLREWSTRSTPLTMAVNVSAAQLGSSELLDLVSSVLERTGIAPAQLCLEITERAILERAARGAAPTPATSLDRLRQLGVRLAIDDFGTGYSSLTHVRQLPVDDLKIDQAFVAGIGRNKGDTSIVAAVIGLAHAMDMVAVAEGVEREEQLAVLRSLGCDHAQGFLLGRPVPAELATDLVASA